MYFMVMCRPQTDLKKTHAKSRIWYIYLIQKCTPMCKNKLFSSSISFQSIKKTTIEPDRKPSSDIREGTQLSWIQPANGITTLPS